MTTFADLTTEQLDAHCAEHDETPDALTATYTTPASDIPRTLEVYDDGAPGWTKYQWYVLGFEYGPTHLIRAQGEGDAYSIWLDILPTIDPAEIPDAYGAYDKLCEHLEKIGHKDTEHLRRFAIEHAPTYLRVLSDSAQAGATEYPELEEGYDYQSNSSGTGIVFVGHYAWMKPLADTDYDVRFSGETS